MTGMALIGGLVVPSPIHDCRSLPCSTSSFKEKSPITVGSMHGIVTGQLYPAEVSVRNCKLGCSQGPSVNERCSFFGGSANWLSAGASKLPHPQAAEEAGPHRFVVEASQSGWRPRGSDGGSIQYRSLSQICCAIERSYSEVCVQNLGRPAARALYEFVAAAVEASLAGYGRAKLALELRYGPESMQNLGINSAGYRLTAAEERYRGLWLDTIYATLQMMRLPGHVFGIEPVINEPWLISIIHRVLEGQRTGEEQSLVRFDRALATAGASGGAAAERAVIAPQWVPISQLVLLTMKVTNETRGGGGP